VRLHYDYSREDLFALMSRDGDGFVRWDSAQALATRVIGEVEAQLRRGAAASADPLLARACNSLLQDDALDPALVASMLRLPSENYLAELASHAGGADVDAIHGAREWVLREVGRACEESLRAVYHRLAPDRPYEPVAEQIAARSLRNTCLEFLCCVDPAHMGLAQRQLEAAHNMTERLAALRVIALHGSDEICAPALERFYREWRHETLVVNLWFQVQAAVPYGDGLGRVRHLMGHPDFDLRNPNKVRALVGVFANQNPVNFHRADGEGYRFLVDVVAELDGINPQMAAGLLTPLTRWRNYRGRAERMRGQLERLAAMPQCSSDVYEVVTKSLA
jgi:aminopeptidase N